MAYKVLFTRAAERQFRRLDRQIQRRLKRRIDGLAEDPRPQGARQLKGTDRPLFRVREGSWRVIYSFEDDKLLILIVRLGHRSDVYE